MRRSLLEALSVVLCLAAVRELPAEIHAFPWSSGSGMQDLGTLGGIISYGTGVNDNGTVVGFSEILDGLTHAFLWTAADGMQDIGEPPGGRYNILLARAINNRDEIVGLATSFAGQSAPFYWSDPTGFIDPISSHGPTRKENGDYQAPVASITGAPNGSLMPLTNGNFILPMFDGKVVNIVTDRPHFGNLSTRMWVGQGDNVGIGGFIVTGIAKKKVIIRALGPSLSDSDVEDFLHDPAMEIYDSQSAFIAGNDNWTHTVSGGQILTDQVADIIATGIAPDEDLEAAAVLTLDRGAYTVVVRGSHNGSGVALVEVYDLDNTVDSKLANISTRAFIQSGDNVLIGGTIVQGTAPAQVVMRAIGPSLSEAGISNPLMDPTLELHDGNGAVLAVNDNWQDGQKDEITAAGLAPTDPKESAVRLTLPPAAYTAIVRGVDGTVGVGLVEAYDLGN